MFCGLDNNGHRRCLQAVKQAYRPGDFAEASFAAFGRICKRIRRRKWSNYIYSRITCM